MKKKFISVLLCGAMTASLFGMGAMAEETKTFTVGFDAEYPPYGYMGDDGEYTGFDLELAQAVCDLEGWELVKTPINCICRAAGRCRRCHRDGHRSSQLSDFYQRQRR